MLSIRGDNDLTKMTNNGVGTVSLIVETAGCPRSFSGPCFTSLAESLLGISVVKQAGSAVIQIWRLFGADK